jgi:hypothetical protein
MKNLKIAIASVLAASTLISNPVLAELGTVNENGVSTNDNIDESDNVTLSFNHPQSLAVSAPNNVTERASGGIINRTWQVVSNNAVTVKMTGKSKTDAGVADATPVFYKQEVDANGDVIADRFDTLVTTYGVTVVDAGSQSDGAKAIWGNGATAADEDGGVNDGTKSTSTDYASVLTGTPADLVNTADGSGLNKTLGTIMPKDNGQFALRLSAKGIGDVATTQSGDYQVTIVATFMANELGNGIVTASTVGTAPVDNTLLSAVDTYTANDLGTDSNDNTNWNNGTTSIAVDGTTEQSADIIQTDDGLSASNATYY